MPLVAVVSHVGRVAAWACSSLAVISLFVMMAMTFIDVIMRSTLDQPIEAATELTRILMAVMVFSILPLVSFQGRHITVDLLDQFVSASVRRLGDSLISIACGVILFWPAKRCLGLAERARDYGDVTEYLSIPTFYLAWFITLSVSVTALVLIARGLLWGTLGGEAGEVVSNSTVTSDRSSSVQHSEHD